MNPTRYYLIPSIVVENRARLVLPSTIFALVVFGIMQYVDRQFRTPQVPLGQVSMQFAFTKERNLRMVASFNESQRTWARYSAIIGE
jgi:hypothetical protein